MLVIRAVAEVYGSSAIGFLIQCLVGLALRFVSSADSIRLVTSASSVQALSASKDARHIKRADSKQDDNNVGQRSRRYM